MKITLISKDRYLWQKLRLLCPKDEVTLAAAPFEYHDALIFDTDTAPGDIPGGAITYSRLGGKALGAVFDKDDLLSALGEQRRERIAVIEDTRSVIIDKRLVRLTDVEFSLFFELYRALGKFVARKTLIQSVWGELGNDSLINVYIHYLREKLEVGSERFIFSSRKLGYKLDVQSTEA